MSTDALGPAFISMGPRSDNRGYERPVKATADLIANSMGPRSDNRGYEGFVVDYWPDGDDFNGSTVR